MDLESIADNLERKEDGIYYSKTREEISYPDEGNEECYQIEQDSFWFNHRNDVISLALDKFGVKGSFFDIGGGNGFVSKKLQENGKNVVLVEPGISGAISAQKRGIKNIVCSTLQDAQFKASSIENIGLFDVVEHIENDEEFLTNIGKYHIKDGKLFITVPAFQFLWSNDDEYAGHFKRYTTKSLQNLVEKCGYKVEFSSYLFSFFPLPMFLLRSLPSKFERLKPSTDVEKYKKEHKNRKGILNSIMMKTFKWELNKINKASKIRMGTSCFIVAKKL